MKVPVVVKRSKLSLFLEVDETDRVRDLKEKLAVMVQKRPSDLQLVMVDNKEDVFLMIRRKKVTVFTDAKEDTTINELKKSIAEVTKMSPEDMRFYKDDQALEDHKKLQECGFTSSTARAQAPATIGMTFRQSDGDFENLEITPLSTPPELPDVMKSPETASHQPEQVAS